MPYHGEKQSTMKPATPKLPHEMHKGSKTIMVKTIAEHKRLDKMGYTHSKK